MTLDLSIVAPVYNEGPIVAELAERCSKAAAEAGVSFEILLVDDCSTDDTRRRAAGLETRGLRFIHLGENRGQFGATQAGLDRAVGRRVVVLDGDLQDPPEMIGALLERMTTGDEDVVFAVKESRVDAGWMKIAARIYGLLQGLGSHRWPRGAGSFCIMSNLLARRVSRLPAGNVNLAAVLVALGAEVATLPYRRDGRWDVESHIGSVGLAKEAFTSLTLTGALPRLLGGMAIALALGGVVAGGAWHLWVPISATLATAALVLTLRARQLMASIALDPEAP